MLFGGEEQYQRDVTYLLERRLMAEVPQEMAEIRLFRITPDGVDIFEGSVKIPGVVPVER